MSAQYPFWKTGAVVYGNDDRTEASVTRAAMMVERKDAGGHGPPVVEPAPAVKFLTSEQAAAVLGLSPRTLERRRMTANGPPYRRIGRGKRAPIRYYLPDVLAWMDENTHRSTSEYSE